MVYSTQSKRPVDGSPTTSESSLRIYDNFQLQGFLASDARNPSQLNAIHGLSVGTGLFRDKRIRCPNRPWGLLSTMGCWGCLAVFSCKHVMLQTSGWSQLFPEPVPTFCACQV